MPTTPSPEPLKTVAEETKWLNDGSGEAKPFVPASFAQQLQDRVQELEKERDALTIEYESRVIWMRQMCDIIGYNNDDGFHSSPSPHDIAKRLVEERDSLRQQLDKAKFSAEHHKHLHEGAVYHREKAEKQLLELSLSESRLRKALEAHIENYMISPVSSGADQALSTPPSEAFRPWVEFVETTLNTIECASIDLKTGEELPWHKQATQLLSSIQNS